MSFLLSEGMHYHINNNLPIRESVYRPGSQSFFNFIVEAKNAYRQGLIEVDQWDHDLLTSDIGEYGEFNGGFVPLDYPIPAELDLMNENVENIDEAEYNGREVELNKPKRGGSKKILCLC